MAERRLPNWKSETSEVFAWSMFNFGMAMLLDYELLERQENRYKRFTSDTMKIPSLCVVRVLGINQASFCGRYFEAYLGFGTAHCANR